MKKPPANDRSPEHGGVLTPAKADSGPSEQASGAGTIGWGPPWIGPVHRRVQIDLLWLLIAVLLTAVGLVFFGWRGLLGVCTAGLSTLVTHVLVAAGIRLFHPARLLDSNLHALVLGLLLGLLLPAMCHPMVPLIGGVVLGVAAHMIGRSHRVRVHPVAAVFLLIWLSGGGWAGGGLDGCWGPQAVLRIERVVVGDVGLVAAGTENQSWLKARGALNGDALARLDAGAVLKARQHDILTDRAVLANLLCSGELVPMVELVLGAVPGTVGGSSPVVLLVAGLYLIYRRLSWWPMVAAAWFAGLVTLLVMPTPHHGQGTLVIWRLIDMGWAVALTYVGYVLLVSPMAMAVMILAPQTAPTSANGRLVYAVVIGAALIVVQWFFVWPVAGCASVVIAGFLSRPLDGLHRSCFAV